MTVAIEADTSGFEKALGDLTIRADAFGTAITSALKGAVSGGRSFEGVLKQLAQRLSSIALNAALKPLDTALSGLLQGLLGGLSGLSGTSGTTASILPFAKGGVVASPTYFPTARRIGLMGEAGAEAVLPLKRGADGTLGVSAPAAGQGGSSIVFNVTASDAASFRRSEAQVQAMLARAVGRGRRGI
ncbi:phage tail tape measure protein [Consotaella aegiceratis]|uniref:phage tail tape measure protein n=1 Tax=Consotaella aegiceratis TaxID=3097961 RepID=UPI002F40C90D